MSETIYYAPELVAEMKGHTNHLDLNGPSKDLYNRVYYCISDLEAIGYAKNAIGKGGNEFLYPDYHMKVVEDIMKVAAANKRAVQVKCLAEIDALAELFAIQGTDAKRRFYAQLESYRVSQRVVNAIEEALMDYTNTILEDAKHDLTAQRLGLCEK